MLKNFKNAYSKTSHRLIKRYQQLFFFKPCKLIIGLSVWVGLVGLDLKYPSTFLSFKFNNKQDVLIANMVPNIVNDFSIGLESWFEVGVGFSPFLKLAYFRGF